MIRAASLSALLSLVSACGGGATGPSLGSGTSGSMDGGGTAGGSDSTGAAGTGDTQASGGVDSAANDVVVALPQTSPETQQFFDELATAVCAKAAACKSALYHYSSPEACKAALLADWKAEHLALLVGQGKMLLSVDNAIQCKKDIAAKCDALAGPPLSSCILAVHGAVQKGKPCIPGGCATTVCQSAGGFCGVCTDAIAEGNTCAKTAHCNPGQVCAGGLCKVPGTVPNLGKCTHTSDCVATSYCGPGGQCAPRLEAGKPCTPKEAGCKSGVVCRVNADAAASCAAPGKAGEACYGLKVTGNIASECEAGLRCIPPSDAFKSSLPKGKCLPLATPGQPCESALQCGKGEAVCTAGKCAPLPGKGQPCAVAPELTDALVCAPGHLCDAASKTCQPGPAVGMACGASWVRCPAGQWCGPSSVCVALGGIGAKCDLAVGEGCLPQLTCDEDAKCRAWPQCLP